MRRRKDSKANNDVTSSNTVARRSSRRKKSPSLSKSEKSDQKESVNIDEDLSEQKEQAEITPGDENNVQSSDENACKVPVEVESEVDSRKNKENVEVTCSEEKPSITSNCSDQNKSNNDTVGELTTENTEIVAEKQSVSDEKEIKPSTNELPASNEDPKEEIQATTEDLNVSKSNDQQKSPDKNQQANEVNDSNEQKSNKNEIAECKVSSERKEEEEDNAKVKENAEDNRKPTRKRKWITKKCSESKEQILAISTDSLRGLISCVDMVPLSDIKFDSSSDFESSQSDHEEGEKSPTPERKIKVSSLEKHEAEKHKLNENVNNVLSNNTEENKYSASNSMDPVKSPTSSQSSSILYITNLVRPFTVLQLKGLLARTGKIVENGFWIDRIKSKCFVEYETEDQAVETRHALHGVRWPVSNPKCLVVEFGKREDMEKAIASSNETKAKLGAESGRENVMWNSGWERERIDSEKKTSKSVREWDVGKKDSKEGDKKREKEKREYGHAPESGSLDRRRDSDQGLTNNNRESGADRRNRSYGREDNSLHPPAKKIMKKENDPPIRLLDDLFRKTKTTPSVYWLPLTPEQISDKEMFRLKRIEEHKERIKQRELERIKNRDKERDRENERNRDRGRQRNERDRTREYRRNHSSDRRRSKSRDRRR